MVVESELKALKKETQGLDAARSQCSVYNELKSSLLRQEFESGDRLLIADLATRYGVSPTPVREALCRLREESLVSFVDGKGYYVPIPDLKELRDLYQALGLMLIFAVNNAQQDQIVKIFSDIMEDFDGRPSIGIAAREALALSRAQLVESALLKAVESANNDAVFRVACNLIDRTHVARLVEMESFENFDRVSDLFFRLRDDICRNARGDAEKRIKSEIDQIIHHLKDVVGRLIFRHYMTNWKHINGSSLGKLRA